MAIPRYLLSYMITDGIVSELQIIDHLNNTIIDRLDEADKRDVDTFTEKMQNLNRSHDDDKLYLEELKEVVK